MVGYKAYTATVSPRKGVIERYTIDAKSMKWAKTFAAEYGRVISVKEQ